MAFENWAGTNPVPFKAGGTIAQYRAVKADSTINQVVACAAITDVPIGTSLDAASSGDQVSVLPAGPIAKMTASGAVSYGDQVMPTASGSGKVMTAAGATAYTIGISLGTASADGDIIPVMLLVAGKGPANS